MIEKRTMPILGRALALGCVLALVAALVPTRALAQPNRAERDVSLTAQASIASGVSGSCIWSIDGDGALVIAPASGTSGTLESFSYTGSTGPSSAPWYAHADAITSVVVRPGVHASTSLSGAFAGLKSVTSIDVSGLSTSGVTDMSHMFSECAWVSSLDLSGFDTAAVTNMSAMFDACSGLKTLDISHFDTARVTDMSAMFRGCLGFTALDVSAFDTAQVTDMSDMFASCGSLTSLDVSGFDTTNVTTMQRMFTNLTLTSLDISNFQTPSLEDMWGMFSYSSALKRVDMSGIDTTKVWTMGLLFEECDALERISLGSGFAFVDDSPEIPDGLWYSSFSGLTYTPEQIATQWKNVKATYVKAKTASSAPAIIRGAQQIWAQGGQTGATFSSNAPLDEFVCVKVGGSVVLPDNYTLVGADVNVTLSPAYLNGLSLGSHSIDLLSATGAAQTTFTVSEDPLINVPVTMYRLYNPNSGEHHYTESTVERDHLISVGWNDEGVGWIAPKGGEPVYRLYNSYAGEHHYTMSVEERDNLVAAGWNDEGIGWRAAGTIPLYRQYNPNEYANNHNYTTSTVERDHLLSLGWQDEGIGWYGIGM